MSVNHQAPRSLLTMLMDIANPLTPYLVFTSANPTPVPRRLSTGHAVALQRPMSVLVNAILVPVALRSRQRASTPHFRKYRRRLTALPLNNGVCGTRVKETGSSAQRLGCLCCKNFKLPQPMPAPDPAVTNP
mmetsp:Transcript_79612/g.133350  ORF Transcript_79612/g.133350 Transcript_79612/m.133350 type:complete len:132 (-) Transcript_79612:106-501(-)